MKNKIAALLILLGVIGFSFSASAAGIPSDVADTEFEGSYAVLNAMGVTDIGAEGLFMPYSRLSRGEFAVMLEKLIQPEDDIHGEMGYSDITESHYAYRAVDFLSYYGYMIGYGDETFKPEQEITYNEAVKVCTGLLGYAQVPSTDDRFYLNAAANAGILGGVSMDNGYINKGNAVKLIANMLDANMVVSNYDGETYTVDGSKTMLTEVCGMYKTRGVVDGDCYQSLSGDTGINEGMIKINSLYMYYEGEDYVGYDVTCYYFENENDDYVVRAIIPRSGRNTVSEIRAEDIDDAGQLYYIEYKAESGRKKKLKYDADTVVIYNGKNPDTFTIDILDIENGWLESIDNDGDGVAECIKVWEYYNVVVDFSNEKEIIDRFDNTKNIYAEDYDKISITDASGDSKGLADAKIGTVASVFKSNTANDNIITIVLSEKAVNGTVNATNIADGIRYVTIDDEEYTVYSGYITFAGSEINLYDEGKYLLDMHNKIVTAGEKTFGGYSVGILTHSRQYPDEFTEQNIIKLKVYLSEGRLAELVADDKLYVDGVTYKNENFYGAETELATHISEPILYKLDKDGKLSKIDTLKQDANGKLKQLTSGITGRYLESTSIIEGMLVIDDNVTVFTVPAEFDDAKEKDFSTAGHSYFAANSTYTNVKGYTVNDGMAAEIAVIQAEASIMNHLSDIVLVTGRGKGINSDEDTVNYLKIEKNGEAKTIYEAETGILDKVYKINKYSRSGDTLELISGRKIDKGDLVKYSTNGNGDIEKVSLIYDASEAEMVSLNPYHTDFHEQGNRYVMGYVDEKYDGYIRLTYKNASDVDVTEYHNVGVGKIYSVEVDDGVTVEEMAFGELSDKVHNGKADKVLIISNAGVPQITYIYK